MGSPVIVLRHATGRGRAGTGARARRSDSSMRCCVPTRRDRNRPERIHRRTVSGLQRALREASGTVSMGVVYYNIHRCTPGRVSQIHVPTQRTWMAPRVLAARQDLAEQLEGGRRVLTSWADVGRRWWTPAWSRPMLREVDGVSGACQLDCFINDIAQTGSAASCRIARIGLP
jgi:hypothetical protein